MGPDHEPEAGCGRRGIGWVGAMTASVAIQHAIHHPGRFRKLLMYNGVFGLVAQARPVFMRLAERERRYVTPRTCTHPD